MTLTEDTLLESTLPSFTTRLKTYTPATVAVIVGEAAVDDDSVAVLPVGW